MTKPLQHIKFGIFCDQLSLKQWQFDAIKLLEEQGAQLELIVIRNTNNQKKPVFHRVQSYPWKNLLYRLYIRYAIRVPALKLRDISQLFTKAELISTTVEKKSYSEYFSHTDVEHIKGFGLDFMLRFGFGIIRGSILQSAKYGIWSYHHGDETLFRGGPPGFWEIYKNVPTTGVVLQKLTEKLDAGLILQRAHYTTIRHSYAAQWNQLLEKAVFMPLKTIMHLKNAAHFTPTPSSTKAPIYKQPSNLQLLYFLLKLIYNKLVFHQRDLLLAEDWNIGWKARPKNSDVLSCINDAAPLQWMQPENRSKYLADPFLLPSNPMGLLAEAFDYHTNKGHIVHIDLTTGEKTTVLQLECHLSYPYSFSHQGVIYVVPESFENQRIDLFILDSEQMKLNYKATLISGIEAVDSSLLHYEGLWWLFFSKKKYAHEHLELYYAERLEGPYNPHPLNPVVHSVYNARSAGRIFEADGNLFRPAQNCAGSYGRSVQLMRIQHISTQNYLEYPVQQLLPASEGKYSKGLHTFNISDDWMVVDGKRYHFVWKHSLRKLKTKLSSRP